MIEKFISFGSKPASNLLQLQNPKLAKELEMLTNHFQETLQFFKKNSTKRRRLHDLPWFMVIGSEGAGKTTLLSHSNVNFLRKNPITKSACSKTCEWWIANHLVLLDVPGYYTAVKDKDTTAPHGIHLKFLDLIKKFRGKNAIQGVLIVISLEELIQVNQQKKLIYQLKNSIHSLKIKFGHQLPFYFIINKCDLLPGFLEFFYDCSSEELDQPWGISFTDMASREHITDVLGNRFNALIKRLNKQLIVRLHQERGTLAKHYIKDFPLHIERLKESTMKVLKSLETTHTGFNLQGVYLTSATQYPCADVEEQYPVTLPSNSLQQAWQMMQYPKIAKKSYFIRQFILQGLARPHHRTSIFNVEWQTHPMVSASLATAAVTSACFLGYTFLQKMSHPYVPAQYSQEVTADDGQDYTGIALNDTVTSNTQNLNNANDIPSNIERNNI